MSVRKSDKFLNPVAQLDFILRDIVSQLRILPQEQKDTPYSKLIELFFKGADLREKICKEDSKADFPQIRFIEGLNEDKI